MNRTLLISIAVLGGSRVACSGEQAPQDEVAATSADTAVVADDASVTNLTAEQASKEITGDYMRGIVVEISDDRYEGRGPGSQGDEMARAYLAKRMEELGLEPAAEDGSWEQPFDLVGVNSAQPDSWTFEGHGQSMTLKQWDQFIVGSGIQEDRAELDGAELVFVGYGIQAPEYDFV